MPNYTVSLYLGSNEEGEKLLRRLEAYCNKKQKSLSEIVKNLILKELSKEA